MKILLANKFFFYKGGAERVYLQDRDFLISRNITILDFSMLHPDNIFSSYTDYFVRNVNYSTTAGLFMKIRDAVNFIHSSEAVNNITRLVEKERPQIAHLHNIYHQLTPSIIPALKRLGVKVIFSIHDAKLLCPAYLMLRKGKICNLCNGRGFYHAAISGCQKSYLRGLLFTAEAYFHQWKKSYDSVDLFIQPSKFYADLFGTRRFPASKLRVLVNGIDMSMYKPTWQDHGYILYFGRLSAEKGVATLLNAHDRLGGGIPLRIVGTGPLEKQFSSRHPQADFLGYKTGEELTALVANASFIIVPSEWYENCSMVVLEAMALGKPVIGSRIGGIPEQVEDGVTGILFPMGDTEALAEAMRTLWNDPELRLAMGLAAREKAEREYSLADHCQGLLSIYEELLSTP